MKYGDTLSTFVPFLDIIIFHNFNFLYLLSSTHNHDQTTAGSASGIDVQKFTKKDKLDHSFKIKLLAKLFAF